MRLMFCLFLVLEGLQLTSALRVAAWNVETFGRSKANLINRSPLKASILTFIARVVRRYDIIVLQEVRDDLAAEPVMNALLLEVRSQDPNGPEYRFTSSAPLGEGITYRERYVYLYRATTVLVAARHQYRNRQAPGAVRITRPPFVVRFQNRVGAAQAFDYTFIPLHSRPDTNHNTQQTVREIDALVDVFATVGIAWQNNPTPFTNVLLLGDFNAGCDYVRNNANINDFDNIRLWNRLQFFRVLIGSTQRTNVGTVRACPYDRIVVTREMHQNQNVVAARVFYFDQALVLPDGVQATDISNHYPVEVELNP